MWRWNALKYNEQGCNTTMVRKEIRVHSPICEYRPVEFCRHIGYLSCDFISSDPSSVTKHILENHRISVVQGPPKASFTSPNFRSYTDPKNEIYYGKLLWETVNSDESSDDVATFVLCTVVNSKQGNYSLVGIQMEKPNAVTAGYEMEFKIFDSRSGVKVPVWKWLGKLALFKDVESIMENPPFRIPIQYLAENVGGGENFDLEIEVIARKCQSNA